MSRFIDADALKEKMSIRKFMVGRDSDADCLVSDAPTIDAIPIEWLEWRIAHAEREGFVEVVKMLEKVRDWWNDQRDLWEKEKEQEAQK